jgi:preprotein translocase subunit SecE
VRAEPTIEKAGGDRPSVIRAFTDYVRDVRVEMSKVSWPSQRDLRDSTLVVIVMVIIVSIFIGIVDRLLSIGFEALIKMLG